MTSEVKDPLSELEADLDVLSGETNKPETSGQPQRES